MDNFLLYAVGVPVTFLALALALALALGMALGVALAARRILGMRIGFIRTTIATLLAMSFTGDLFSSLSGTEDAETVYATVLLGVTLLLLIGMVALAEVIVPTGSIPPPVDWFRAVVPGVDLHHLFGYNLLVISVLLGFRVVVTIFRPRGA